MKSRESCLQKSPYKKALQKKIFNYKTRLLDYKWDSQFTIYPKEYNVLYNGIYLLHIEIYI